MMQLADEDRSDAVRRDRRLRDRRERADASVLEHGTQRAMQVNSTRHALGIFILTSRSFFLGEPSLIGSGAS